MRLRLALAAALLGTGCGGSERQAAPEPVESAVVAYVNDGDTLRLVDGRRVRLVQIDAPERDGECFGHAATAALVGLAPRGTKVELERDPGLDSRDEHGRLLRYVFARGRNLNLELVREGAAAPYFYRGVRGRYAGEFVAAASAASAQRRGLWGACPGTPLRPDRGVSSGPA